MNPNTLSYCEDCQPAPGQPPLPPRPARDHYALVPNHRDALLPIRHRRRRARFKVALFPLATAAAIGALGIATAVVIALINGVGS